MNEWKRLLAEIKFSKLAAHTSNSVITPSLNVDWGQVMTYSSRWSGIEQTTGDLFREEPIEWLW